MQLTDLQLELRPRHAWEAVDLGQSMYRRWWWPLQSAWFLTFLPLAIGLGVAFADRPYLALAILWWLLPFVERAPLFVLGRCSFGDEPRLTQVLGELPGLLRRRALWRLTLARLSPWRGFAAPIAVLERTTGADARRRASVLMGGGGESSTALAVSLVSWSFVLGLATAINGLVTLFLPDDMAEEFSESMTMWFLGETTSWPGLVLYAYVCISMSVVGPLFVAVNFSLYLNRRIFLEGWDIEVAFRSLAARLEKVGRTGAILLAVLLLAVARPAPAQAGESFHGSAPASAALAQDAGDADTTPEVEHEEGSPKAVVEGILAHEDFDTTITREVPVPKSRPERGPDLSGLANLFGNLTTIVLVGAAIGLLLYLIYLAAKYAEGRADGDGAGARAPRPVEVAGLDVRLESLPDDPASAALVLWRNGERREALSLLYRAAIARIVDRFDVPIVDGDTEGLCLLRVRQARVPGAGTFGDLTATWQGCAYGDRVPDDVGFEGLVGSWRSAFGPTVAPSEDERGGAR